jgi:hypothetical protein
MTDPSVDLLAMNSNGQMRKMGLTPGGIATLNSNGQVLASTLPAATSSTTGAILGLTTSTTTALGSKAMSPNVTGTNNMAIGPNSAASLTSGTDNIAIGSNTLDAVTTGTYNTAISNNTLGAFTGTSTVAIGHNVLSQCVNSTTSTTCGYNSLANLTANYGGNSAFGWSALGACSTGINNTGVGSGVMMGLTMGSYNAAVGQQAFQNLTMGAYNMGMGTRASLTLTMGSRNTCVGHNANINSAAALDRIALGYNTSATANGQFAVAPAINTITVPSMANAVAGSGTEKLLVIDSSGNIKPAGSTHTMVSKIDGDFTPYFWSAKPTTDWTMTTNASSTYNVLTNWVTQYGNNSYLTNGAQTFSMPLMGLWEIMMYVYMTNASGVTSRSHVIQRNWTEVIRFEQAYLSNEWVTTAGDIISGSLYVNPGSTAFSFGIKAGGTIFQMLYISASYK